MLPTEKTAEHPDKGVRQAFSPVDPPSDPAVQTSSRVGASAPVGAEVAPGGSLTDRGDDDHPFRADLRKYFRVSFGTERPTLAQRFRLCFHYGVHCVAVYRFDRLAQRVAARHRWLGIPLLVQAKVLTKAMELFHHVVIYAEIGPGFHINHTGMIYIGPTTIGRNFSIAQNITIGFGHSERTPGYPVIGDDVWIGPGCIIAGPIHIGNGATLSHGAVLSRSVPPRALAAGNPGRPIMLDFDNSHLLGHAGAGKPR